MLQNLIQERSPPSTPLELHNELAVVQIMPHFAESHFAESNPNPNPVTFKLDSAKWEDTVVQLDCSWICSVPLMSATALFRYEA